MKPVIWVIGGTSDGRRLIEEIRKLPVEIYVSVATEYGAALLTGDESLHVMARRMNKQQMLDFIAEKQPACVVDATHPYATIVTATVQAACAESSVEYVRMVRPVSEDGDYTLVDSFEECVELLNHLDGNIFLTTGSKNLPDFVKVENYQERIRLRILPMESSLKAALDLGYKPGNIVCMQGPFAKDLNIATLRKFNAKYMVTKDSGEVGGFSEKLASAKAAGARMIVIGRQSSEEGAGYAEMLHYLKNKFGN